MNSSRSFLLYPRQVRRPGGVVTELDLAENGTSIFRVEDWIIAGAVCTTASRTCGEFHWWMTGTNSVMAAPSANETAHPGMRVLRTGATIGNTTAIDNTAAAGTLTWDNNFDSIWVVKGIQSSDKTRQIFGLCPDFGVDPPVTGAYFQKRHDGDTGGNDTNWFFVCGNGTVNRTNTGVAHGTGWFTARVRRVSSTQIAWSICSGDGCKLGAETTTATNCPTGTGEARLGAQIETNEAVLKDMALDYIDLVVTGIAR